MEIRHVSHKKHALGFAEISEEVEAPLCDGCMHLIRGRAYTCKRCNFWLHEKCVQLPPEIKYSEHKLTLDNYRVPARVYPDPFHPASLRLHKTHQFICDACGDLTLAFGYYCVKRDFSLDINCASLKNDQSSSQTFKGKDKWKSARHGEYDLTLCKIRKELEIVCEFCKKLISGLAYTCNRRFRSEIQFFLHESCIHILEKEADLKHPFHSQHPLIFVVFEGAQCWTCKVCLTDIRGSTYGCIYCEFYVHVSCSSYRAHPIMHACHEHDLFYFNATKYPESARPKCKVCEGSCKSSFYRCCDCEINFHLRCMPLLPEIKCDGHEHPLVISGSFAENNSINCHSCGEERAAEQEVYVCKECPYFAHIECLPSTRVMEIQHFFHEQHALRFTEISKEVEAPRCNGCMNLIRGHAFTCRHCKFWLHESCAQLPREIEHPAHSEHKLTLDYYQVSPDFFRLAQGNKYICDACGDLNWAFGYHCKTCDFALDIKCVKDDKYSSQADKLIVARSDEHLLVVCNIRKELTFEIVCEFCKKLISGLAYFCRHFQSGIDILLHESCVHILEADLKHPFHTQHPLRFVILAWSEYWTCKACLSDIGESAYGCIDCEFYLHVSCSSYRPRPLTHASHEHDLFYFNGTKDPKSDPQSDRLKCEVCEGSCTSSFYRCCDCGVNFHLGCMPLPPQIKCEAHEHPLVISGSSVENNSVNCHSCGKGRDAEQEVYACEECPYFAHIECLLSTWVVYHTRHKHALYLNEVVINRDNAPCCNGCSLLIINGSAAYFCPCCNFWLHKSCMDLPSQIKEHPYHSHHDLLTLLSKHPHNYDSTDFICDHCGDLNRGFAFHCKICLFNLDVKCAAQQGAQLTLSRKDIKTTFKHFCHDQHPLTRCNFRMELGLYCVSCLKSISGPACACCECQFYIHESCVNSISQEAKSFYHHQHTLSPRRMGPTDVTCNACLVKITGFAFWCEECKFNLHVSCSTNYPTRALKHECHKHDLYYFEKTKLPRSAKCKVCDKSCDQDSFFRCVDCDANFHLSCALPSTVKHKWHRHSLHLMDYFNEEEYLIDHYCDICETQRNIEHEVYACEGCLCVAHTECVASQEKVHHFGHKDDLSLSVVMREDNNAPCCNGCGHLIHDLAAYTCLDCNFWLHKSCFELPQEIIRHPFHVEHSLSLKWESYHKFFTCNACRDLCSAGLYYGCSIHVDFHLDLKCSFLSSDHSVPHGPPDRIGLDFKTLSSSIVGGSWGGMAFTSCNVREELQIVCDACELPIQGQTYEHGDEYYFHKFCLSDLGLGIEINERPVPFHSQHRFQLGDIRSDTNVRCNACRQNISRLGLVCKEDCKLILHFLCAKYETRALRHQCHEHDLLYFGPKNLIITDRWCRLCRGTCMNGPFLGCMYCDFDIHLKCVPLPDVVKHSCHLHPLKLIDGVVKNDSEEYNCDVCMEIVNPEHQVYSCEGCHYIAHIDCVNSEDEPPEEILSYLVPWQRQMRLEYSDHEKAASELDEKAEESDTKSSVPDDQLDEKITKIKALMEELPIEQLKALLEGDKMLFLKS